MTSRSVCTPVHVLPASCLPDACSEAYREYASSGGKRQQEGEVLDSLAVKKQKL